jgi:hypothetical protein
MSQAQANSMPQQPYKRQLKNFLLMPAFQLKYTGAIVVISALLASGLGYVVYQRTQVATTQTETALASAQTALTSAQKANETARESSKLVAMGSENMQQALDKADAEYSAKAQEIEQKASDLKQKAADLGNESQRTILFLGGFLGFLVLALGLFGIVMTHRIAGPLFVLSRLFQNIAQNNFHLYKRSLRKGDEFPDIFEKGVAAIDHLAGAAKSDNARVAESLSILETLKGKGADPQLIGQIEEKLKGMSFQKAKLG